MTRAVDGIRAVFFDSGGTLAGPIGAGWWPKPGFAELISAAGLSVPADDRIRAAHDTGQPFLSQHPKVVTLDDEVAVYRGFYEIVLDELFAEIPPHLVERLADAAVFTLDQQLFADTVPGLDQLSADGISLGIISNAGPSLELRYRDMGIRERFDPFVVSAVVGTEKPGERIYQLALDRVGVRAAEVAFVDDVPENVRVAAELGMTGFVIDRDGASPHDADLPIVNDLTRLRDALGLDGYLP